MTKTVSSLVLTFLLIGASLLTHAQFTPLWMSTPSISPDGKTIVFIYKGDLYKVSAQGGNAMPLTLHKGHDKSPIWSKDGKNRVT